MSRIPRVQIKRIALTEHIVAWGPEIRNLRTIVIPGTIGVCTNLTSRSPTHVPTVRTANHQKASPLTYITLTEFVEQTSVKAVPYWIFNAYTRQYLRVKRADNAHCFPDQMICRLCGRTLSFTRLKMCTFGGIERTPVAGLILSVPRVTRYNPTEKVYTSLVPGSL